VVALQVAVSHLNWPWPIKFATILVVALPVMLASYHLLVRYTYIGIVLNGPRLRRHRTLAVATGFAATSCGTAHGPAVGESVHRRRPH
jgi:hypothetical protein